MLIVLEGIDGSGKTTLLKQLAEHDVQTVVGENRFDVKSIRKYRRYYKQWHHSKKLYAVDRSYLTDLIYRSIDSGPAGLHTVSDMYKYQKCVDILIYCNSANAFKNSMKRGEDNIVDITTSNKLRERYDFCVSIIKRYSNIKVLTYDYDNMSITDVLKFIREVSDGIR